MANGKILIIEADPFLSKLYTVKLKDLKFEVDTALNGEEGHHLLKLNHYDGVLMNLVLPYRDGFTLLQDMKRLRKRLKVKVIVSELQQKEDLEKAAKLGADHYFVKNENQTYEIIEDFKALIQGKRLPHRSGYSMKNGKPSKLKATMPKKSTAKKKPAAPKKNATPSKKAAAPKKPSPKRKAPKKS